MFRRLTAAAGILLATTALAAPAANAEIAPIDAAPAATLLLPYFEADLNAPAPAPAGTNLDNVLWGDYYSVDPAPAQAGQPVDANQNDGGDRGRGRGHDRGGHGRG